MRACSGRPVVAFTSERTGRGLDAGRGGPERRSPPFLSRPDGPATAFVIRKLFFRTFQAATYRPAMSSAGGCASTTRNGRIRCWPDARPWRSTARRPGRGSNPIRSQGPRPRHKLGEMTMDKELLEEKVRRLEARATSNQHPSDAGPAPSGRPATMSWLTPSARSSPRRRPTERGTARSTCVCATRGCAPPAGACGASCASTACARRTAQHRSPPTTTTAPSRPPTWTPAGEPPYSNAEVSTTAGQLQTPTSGRSCG